MLFLSKFGSNTNNKLLHLLDCSFNLSEKRNFTVSIFTENVIAGTAANRFY